MNIVFICKRYYTGKDVIRHRFGRLYELPSQLANLGHSVTVLCLDYRNREPQENFIEKFDGGSVQWFVVPLRRIYTLEVLAVYRKIKVSQTDMVLGSSDIPCLWFARKLAKTLKVPYAVDLYDNYESFGQACIPGFRYILKTCVKNADLVMAVSNALKDKIESDCKPLGSVVVMSNGVHRSSFFAGEKSVARAELSLPAGKRLIGTAGGLSRMKGLDIVYDAWSQIEKQTKDVCLVLAGRIEFGFSVPGGARVIYLGELLEDQVGQLFRALDVGIIPAHDSEFGRYCFPQKLYEMVACELPVAASKVGAIAEVLKDSPEMLYKPGDSKELAEVVRLQLDKQRRVNVKPMEWVELVVDVETALLGLLSQD